MNKTEFISAVADETGIKKTDTAKVIDAILAVTIRSLTTNGEALLPGIGKLVRKERPARKGRNPKTGEVVDIPAGTSVKLRVSAGLKASAQ